MIQDRDSLMDARTRNAPRTRNEADSSAEVPSFFGLTCRVME